MISRELADPFGLFFKYLKSFFSTVLSFLYYNTINPKTIKAPSGGLRIRGKLIVVTRLGSGLGVEVRTVISKQLYGDKEVIIGFMAGMSEDR
jgi:hypothetical protein